MNPKEILTNPTKIANARAKCITKLETLDAKFPIVNGYITDPTYLTSIYAINARIILLEFAQYAVDNYGGNNLDLIIDYAVKAFETRTADVRSDNVPHCDFFNFSIGFEKAICKDILKKAAIEREVAAQLKADEARAANGGCYKCGGTGRINAFSHVEAGICFACDGKGERTRRQRAA